MIDDLNGLVLAGGKSTRMGSDKSLIHYYGIPQRDFVFNLLEKFCTKVYVSSGRHQTMKSGHNSIQDSLDIATPLNGILSAFRHDHSKGWLSIPVDMPLIDQDAIAELLGHRDKSCVATCFLDSSGLRPEPLVAIWEQSAHKLLESFYRDGGSSPREFLAGQRIKTVGISNPRALININTLEELRNFRISDRNLR